ncbi:MAG: CBS domain-containing protein [Deltaproteobacteria bacterium]|nr:CBS domain-containing protein [Deltaproteobacteria bacterium]
MVREKGVRDLVIPLTDYPHMPYWGTLREAIVQLNVSYETGHHTIMVFNEAYKLVGMLLQNDILRAIEPKFGQGNQESIPISWDDLLNTVSEKRLALPIKEFMSEATVTIDAEESILMASHMMLEEATCLLPVTEGERFIGVVRMEDLFHEITNAMLKL